MRSFLQVTDVCDHIVNQYFPQRDSMRASLRPLHDIDLCESDAQAG